MFYKNFLHLGKRTSIEMLAILSRSFSLHGIKIKHYSNIRTHI